MAAAPRWRHLRGLASRADGAVLHRRGAGAVRGGFAREPAARSSTTSSTAGSVSTWYSALEDADDLASTAVGLFGFFTLATAVVFIIWMWRAAKNNEALGRSNPRLGPGWSIGGWFIPLANFVIPVLIMQDLWRGSDATVARNDHTWRTGKGSAIVGWWWGTYLLGNVRIFVGSGNADDNTTISDIKRSNQISLVAFLITTIAAVFAIRVVRTLTARQEDCLRAQQAAWNAANPTA